MRRVAEDLNQVIGICFDGEHVYWTDISVQVESIMKAKTDGTEMQVAYKSTPLNNILFIKWVSLSITCTDAVYGWPRKTRRHRS